MRTMTNILEALGRTFAVSPVSADAVRRLRSAVLVQHAIGKCYFCGSTLCNDPLPHRCGRWFAREGNPRWPGEA